MIDAGVNAKALSSYMGHSSIDVTFDLYGHHLMPGSEAEAASLLEAYLQLWKQTSARRDARYRAKFTSKSGPWAHIWAHLGANPEASRCSLIGSAGSVFRPRALVTHVWKTRSRACARCWGFGSKPVGQASSEDSSLAGSILRHPRVQRATQRHFPRTWGSPTQVRLQAKAIPGH
jgi:hypothetical protein